jgi:hypothetical protein
MSKHIKEERRDHPMHGHAKQENHAKEHHHGKDDTPHHKSHSKAHKTHHPGPDHGPHKKSKVKEEQFQTMMIGLIALVALLLLFNQWQIFQANTLMGLPNAPMISSSSSASTPVLAGAKDLEGVDVAAIASTGHAIAAVMDVESIATEQDAIAVMIAQGTPDYGEDLGVTFDDPVTSLETLARLYEPLKAQVKQDDPEAFARFITLASEPKGISCEFCCGIGPIGADKAGESRCGCSHNPGVLSVALYLSAYTDYNDAEIIREVMRWKTLWFPRDMIGLALTVAGGDTSKLADLPGMVGGC